MRLEPVGGASAPAGLTDTVGDRRLPLRDLIRVREQLIRARRARLILLPCQRLHERADIADKREPLLDPERLQFRETRVQPEWAVDARRIDGDKVPIGKGESRSIAGCGICRYSVVVAGMTMLFPSFPPARKTQTSARYFDPCASALIRPNRCTPAANAAAPSK